jgi:hypothetical protein
VGTNKIDGNKFGQIDASWGRLMSVCAGNVSYASAFFQELEEAKEDEDTKVSPLHAIKLALDDFYTSHVFQHPAYDRGEHDFWMIFSLWLHGEPARLYSTESTTVREIRAFNCIGWGQDQTREILRQIHSERLSLQQASALASYALSHTKHHAQYCGGPTIIRVQLHDGEIGAGEDSVLNSLSSHVESVGPWFIQECQRFLLRHADGNEEEFNQLMTLLTERASYIRNMWNARLAGQEFPNLSIPQPTAPQPWPE